MTLLIAIIPSINNGIIIYPLHRKDKFCNITSSYLLSVTFVTNLCFLNFINAVKLSPPTGRGDLKNYAQEGDCIPLLYTIPVRIHSRSHTREVLVFS